jgi:hypothetical protein
MKKLGGVLILLCALFSAPSGADEVRMSIGVELFDYPEMEAIPGYPVYYAPQLRMNYFFYDGKYWVFQDDNWYESSWYDGPWWLVDPEDVPDFILRIPLQYYLEPPTFFFGWIDIDPPRWGEHWGHEWERHRHGWDKWDHRIHLKPAPLPLYQKEYLGDRYPREIEVQRELRQKHYRYQPQDPFVQQRRQQEVIVLPGQPRERLQDGRGSPRETLRPAPSPQSTPARIRTVPSQREAVREQREVRREPRMQEYRGQEERPQGAVTKEPKRGQEQERRDRRER